MRQRFNASSKTAGDNNRALSIPRLGLAALLAGVLCAAAVAEPVSIPPRWRSLCELLDEAGRPAGTRYAMPSGVGGNVFAGDAEAARPAESWAKGAAETLGFTIEVVSRDNADIWVAHLPDDDALQTLSDALAGDDVDRAVEAAWRLGWSRDARAVRPLARACADDRLPVALAAAAALERLDGEGRPQPMELSDDIRAARGAAPDVTRDWRLRYRTRRGRRMPVAAVWPDITDAATVRRLLASKYVPLRRAGVRLSVALPDAADLLAEAANDGSPAVSEPARVLAALLALDAGEPRELPEMPSDDEIAAAITDLLEGQRGAVLSGCRTLLPAVLAGHEEATAAVIKVLARENETADSLTVPMAASVLRLVGGEQVEKALADAVEAGFELRRVSPWAPAVSLAQVVAHGSDFYEAVGREGILSRGNQDQGGGAYMLARMCHGMLDDAVADLIRAGDGAEVTSYRAAEALGFVGGPRAVSALSEVVRREIPVQGGRKNYPEASVHFAAAKALGEAGTAPALQGLLALTEHEHHLLRWAAVLGLREIGGPQAVARLTALTADDEMRLVRAASADALEEIDRAGTAEAVAEFRDRDEGGGRRAQFNPRNEKLADLPTGEWVRLDIGLPHSGHGGHEVSWDYDVANRLFIRIGGCGYFYGNSIFALDLGTETVVMIRPNDWWSGWHGLMPSPGCCGGRVYDPDRQVVWFGPSTSAGHGSGIYPVSFGTYHPATDRIEAHRSEGIGRTRHLVYDLNRQWVVPIGPTRHGMRIFDTETARPVNFGDTGCPYNRNGDGSVVGLYNPLDGRYYMTGRHRGEPFRTLVFDHEERQWNKLDWETPPMTSGAGGYDVFNKVRFLTGQLRGEETTFWVFDCENPQWVRKDVEAPDRLHAHTSRNSDFDPEHNVLVVFGGWSWSIHVFRYKEVPAGTTAEY